MKKTFIRKKVFVFTSTLLICLLMCQLVFQSLFLGKFYAYQKKCILEKELKNLEQAVLRDTPTRINDSLHQLSQKLEVVAGIMTLYGVPLYGFEVSQAFMELQTEDGKVYKVYLEPFIQNEAFKESLIEGKKIVLDGHINRIRNNEIYPSKIEVDGQPFDGFLPQATLPSAVERTIAPDNYLSTQSLSAITVIKADEVGYEFGEEQQFVGKIKSVYVPSEHIYRSEYRQNKLLGEGMSFIQKVALEEGNLLIGEVYTFESVDSFVGAKNMVGVVPFRLDGEPVLLMAMMSFEQIEEATQIVIQYTIIIFIFISILALLAAYFYAKRLTEPLVELRNVTRDIAHLEFRKVYHVTSRDEIGELADHINTMSDKLKETLESLNQDIETKDRLNQEKKQFIADVSHELKTPLTVLKGTCEGMLNGMYDLADATHVETMMYHINDMGELVQELLDVSKLDRQVVLEKEPFDLCNSLLRIHKKLKPLLEEKKLKVLMEVDEAIVEADKKRIETVLKNIYTNAISYTPPEESIHIWLEKREDTIRFSIENKGVHIEESKLEKIWDAFYRVEASRNKMLGGSGLGLYMVKQILEKHEVLYGIENTEQGVKVWFELEQSKQEEA